MAKRLAEESGEDHSGWIAILKLLARAHCGLQPDQIARNLNATEFDTEFLLCELENEALVTGVSDHSISLGSFKITQPGSRYLSDRESR